MIHSVRLSRLLIAMTCLACAPSFAAERNLLAAPGVVEPVGEEREVASEVIGRIEKMLVEENQQVKANQVIAIIARAELEAHAASARATLALRKAELARLMNGARAEERRELAAVVEQLEAERDYLRADLERQTPLAQAGVAAKSRLEQARSQFDAAEARLKASRERLAVAQGAPRPDDIQAADARVAAAQADVDLAAAQLEKTTLRSPIDGTVLRLERKAGEVVGNQPPTLVAVIGDLSRLRVRAEVDELDVGRIATGQQVQVSASAYPGKRFAGKVVQVNRRMGKKQIFTGRAAERLDNRALQVLVELEPGVDLPVGLMMDVYVVDAPR